jgi:nitrogen fixation protein FixH
MTIRWWMPLAAGVTLVAIANTTLVLTALQVRPTKVAERTYAAEHQEDRLAAERAAWNALGWRLTIDPLAQGVRVAALVPTPHTATVSLWRPDDPGLDRTFTWDDPTQPLAVPLAKSGRWRLRILAEHAGQRARAETMLDTSRTPDAH